MLQKSAVNWVIMSRLMEMVGSELGPHHDLTLIHEDSDFETSDSFVRNQSMLKSEDEQRAQLNRGLSLSVEWLWSITIGEIKKVTPWQAWYCIRRWQVWVLLHTFSTSKELFSSGHAMFSLRFSPCRPLIVARTQTMFCNIALSHLMFFDSSIR